MPKTKDLVFEDVKCGTIDVPCLPIAKGTSIQVEVEIEEAKETQFESIVKLCKGPFILMCDPMGTDPTKIGAEDECKLPLFKMPSPPPPPPRKSVEGKWPAQNDLKPQNSISADLYHYSAVSWMYTALILMSISDIWHGDNKGWAFLVLGITGAVINYYKIKETRRP